MTLRVRVVSDEEREELGRMARSRTVGAGLVRRAQIVLHALEGQKAPEISARMDLGGVTVRHWLKRFNACGLQGLEEDVRTGRPPTYPAEQRSAVINTALTPPAQLGLPFASWTLDRLVTYLSEQGVAMRRSRISEIFIQEGLKWQHEETWFGERVDPEFARKRGRSSSSIRQPRPARHGGLRVRRLAAGEWRGLHLDLRAPHYAQLGRLPGRGRGLDRPDRRAGLRRARQP